MTGEVGGERSATRRLEAIMFTDMVGYSARVQQDEPLAMQLLDEHRRIVRKLVPGFGGREVETAGDSFLIEFDSALDALHCAIALQQRHAERNASAAPERQVLIRVGLHVGDIEHRKGGKVFGDGVNLAARVEPLAPHGGIAVSAPFHAHVRHRVDAPFRSLGAQALKNIAEPMEVLALDPAAIAALPPPQPRSGLAALRPDWRWAAAAVLLVALAVAFVLQRQAPSLASGDKSVAVLPFANFSSEKENEYFAAGIHESILTHLARVKDLKVISRTSVTQYQGGARNLREIGAALDVANIVEGSVQKVGNRVRVQAQLIEVATDRHLWAESYDRDVADVFTIQSEVAQHIVTAVQATLTPQERELIEQRPTANTQAYDLYLRSEEIWRNNLNPVRELVFRIQSLLEQAIALDPGFALAHARLASNHMRTYWWGFDTSRRREQALAAAQTALRLQPDLAEGHYAMGLYYYFGFRDYDRALKEFGEALSRAPNSVETIAWIAYVQRRQGAWDGALASLNRAAELDPRNGNTVLYQGDTYWTVRQYAKAAPYFDRAQALAPEGIWEKLWVAYFQLLWKGDPEPIRQALARVPPGVDPGETATQFRVSLATYEGRYEEAIALLTASPRDGFAALQGSNFEVPKDFTLGQLHTALGKADRARVHFVRARDRLQAAIAREPEGIFLAHAHGWLGLTHAYLGEKAEASRNADRALELLPISRDALDGPWITQVAAATRLRLGDHGRALAELGKIVGKPGGPDARLLPRDPDWQPLWNDPRFKKLIAENLPAA